MTTTTPAAPAPGLIASLGVRLWLDHTSDGRQFAPLLLTHPPARRGGETAATIERDMRLVADSLGALPPGPSVPYVGERVALRDGGLLLVRFNGAGHVLRVRKVARLADMLDHLGHVLIVVGLDPLDKLAHGDAVDRYIEGVCEAGRVRFARADVDARLSLP